MTMDRSKLVIFFVFFSFFHSSHADTAYAYQTGGVGSLEKCKKVVISVCDSEQVSIPLLIDTSDPLWSTVYHRTKKDGSSMCWLKLKDNGFAKETLSFQCKPLR